MAIPVLPSAGVDWSGDLTPPKTRPMFGRTMEDILHQTPESPEVHPPLSGTIGDSEAGKGVLLKATEGISDQVSKGIQNALSIFIPSSSQKRDFLVYGLAVVVFVVALQAMLK